MAASAVPDEEAHGTESDVQALYSKVKKLLLTYPLSPRWSSSYETMNELQLQSETSFGVMNQAARNTLCRSNLDDESIISDLDYNRSLKSSVHKQYDEYLLLNESASNIAKYVLQNLIHTLQHCDIVPYHLKPRRQLRVTKCVGISTSDAHKFNDGEYFYDSLMERRIVQVQVCFDKHVHGLQVKWLIADSGIYSGSQHFSSRFSGKNIDTLVLKHNEYICCVTGTCSNWIDSLIIHTNFGRTKSFGSTNEGKAFDLEIPENCQVLGFCGSYSSQLYTLGALYRPVIIKESKEIMVQHINKRIMKMRQISLTLRHLFADQTKKCNSDLVLLKCLRSQQSKENIKSYKTSANNIRNTWICEILKVLVKSTAQKDPTVIPEILNILALILEDNTINIFTTQNDNHPSPDTYDDLMTFMQSIAQQLPDNNNNQCVRVMIAVAIARGSLYDMLSIVKMLLSSSDDHQQQEYNVYKILNKLHSHIAQLKPQQNTDDNTQQNTLEFHPTQSMNKYAQCLNNENESTLSRLELCLVLLCELELIALHNNDEKKLNKEALNAPLHIDCSYKVLSVLHEILNASSNQLINETPSDIMHRIVYHSLQLLMVQVSTMDRLRITVENFAIPKYKLKQVKSILLTVMRCIPNIPPPLIEAAATTLVKGQKLFFATVNTKLIYLLALLIRQQEIEHNDDDEYIQKNIKLKKFLRDFSDDLVDPLSSITAIEIQVTLPFMLNQFGSVGQPSQFIESLLSNSDDKKQEENDDEKKERKENNDDDNQSRKLFFGTLEMLVSNCRIDINNLDETRNERMAELLLDLQSMLLFRYQSKFEHGAHNQICSFSDTMPISLQEVWSNLYEKPSQQCRFETSQQQHIDECLFQYTKHVLRISMQTLQDINERTVDNEYLSFFFENNCDILHESFFGKIAIPLLTHLLALIETTTKDTQTQKIFKHLMRNKLFNNLLTPHISDLLKLTDEILTKSKNYCHHKLRKEYKTVYEHRESPHPYHCGKTIKKLVTIPGAKELVITFDKTVCCTSSEKDFLRVFTKTCNGFVPVTSSIHGPSCKWAHKIIVPGDCVLFHFVSKTAAKMVDEDNDNMSEQGTEYGFKLSVEGEILIDHMHKLRWMEDLSCLMVKFHTTIASSFIDPGHIGLSFDPLLPFPLLLLGGYYPYKVTVDMDKKQSHLYLPQIQSWGKIKNGKRYQEYDELLWKIHDLRECKLDTDTDDDEYKSQLQANDDDAALNQVMDALLICWTRSSILLFEETYITKQIVIQLQCAIFAVLLRHTGIISLFAECMMKICTISDIPREVQELWERARVGVNQILDDIPSEGILLDKKSFYIQRTKLLMKLSPAFIHIFENTECFDSSKLVIHCEGYLSPIDKQTAWICNVCFHFNDSQQFQCQICESEKHKNKTQGINVRFTWSKKNFPSEELYTSFQSVCCVENIIRSQRHTTHDQNYYKVAPIKKLVKQMITFITRNETSVDVFSKLLITQSTLGLFRIKGLQIIYSNIINLSYAQNIAQFAEHLSNLLTLSNVESMSSTSTLNLTESKQIEKSVANLKLSSIHSGGFAHILSNIECCGYGISLEILTLLHNIIHFLFNQSEKCDNHQLGFTTPLLHLIGTLIRSQDLEWISSTQIIPYLSGFFTFSSLNGDNSSNISFQQRFAAWNAFRTLLYSAAFPMFSSLPTISVDSIHKQCGSVANTSPSSKCVALFANKTEVARTKVFKCMVQVIINEFKTINEQKHKMNHVKDEDLKQILLKLHGRRSPDIKVTHRGGNKALNKKRKWSCGVCTFVNRKEDDTCSMCFRGVRPSYSDNDNECSQIKIYSMCLNCGACISPNKCSSLCSQCGCVNEDLSPLTCIYNEKLQLLKWIDRLRQQAICNADMQYLYLLQQDIGWISSSSSSSPNIHSLSSSFGINQLLWALLRCCPCQEFLCVLSENCDILNLLLDIVGDDDKIRNISPISKILSIKILIWLLPNMNPYSIGIPNMKVLLENMFREIGESDYYSWNRLGECLIKKESDRIKNDVCLELLYLMRVLFQDNAWTEMIENICFRILSSPFNKSDDVTMDASSSSSNATDASSSKCSSSKSTPTRSRSGYSDADDDDGKFELEHIGELVATPCRCALSKSSSPFGMAKRRLSFEEKEKEKEELEHFNVRFSNLNSAKCTSILHSIIGILCVMGEFMSPLHEGVRVKVKHRDKEFTGSIIKIKNANASDPTGEFVETQILCDNGLNLYINITNKEQFDISILDNTSFNPLKLRRPKYLLLLLRSYIHETFICGQFSESSASFCSTILRRVISVIRQFSRYNEFALMIQDFGLIKDLVAVSLSPLQKFEDHFDSSLDDENIWKRQSRTKNHEEWRKNLKIGSIIDCQDRLTKWFESEIVQFDYTENKMLIHYCEWSSKWDEWLSLDSDRISPWRTHTDGSFKNRGYNPFSGEERMRMNLKLRNPNKNIKILQKCILALNKFHKQVDDDIGGDDTQHTLEINYDDDDDVYGDAAQEEEEEEDAHKHKTYDADALNTKHKTGIPCPNHVYLPSHSLQQSAEWHDMISNESLTMVEAKSCSGNNKCFVLKGKCNICCTFTVNAPPRDHLPHDYEFAGSTLFVSMSVPSSKIFDEAFVSLFEFHIDGVCTFNVGFCGCNLCIVDNEHQMHRSKYSISGKKKHVVIMFMISVTKSKYSIYTNCVEKEFVRTISISAGVESISDCETRFSIMKAGHDTYDGIGVQRIAIWKWIALDFAAYCYLSEWKDIFKESLQHLNPSKDCTIFEANYTNNNNNNKAEDSNMENDDDENKKDEMPLFKSPPKVFNKCMSMSDSNDCRFTMINVAKTYHQYSIILSFKLIWSKDGLPHAINLMQIPDDLSLSILERDVFLDANIVALDKESQTPQNTHAHAHSPAVSEEVSHSVLRHIIREPRRRMHSLKNRERYPNEKASPHIPMVWIDKKGFLWICDEKTNKRVFTVMAEEGQSEEHVVSLCVNCKKQSLSLMFDTDEIISIKTGKGKGNKWQRNFGANGCWILRRKLICGGSIHPPYNEYESCNNFVISRITIKPKCCSVQEAISLALTCFFENDPLSDLMGNLGFNVEQIKYCKKWKSKSDGNDAANEWLDLLLKMTEKYRENDTHTRASKMSHKNVKIQFKKKEIEKKKYKNNSTKNYLHICASAQLNSVSPEEIRWKTYKKCISYSNVNQNQNNENNYNNQNENMKDNYDEMKRNLLYCSHWLYALLPSAMQQKQLLSARICNFTWWNREKTSNVLSHIMRGADVSTLDDQSWYHLIEIMYRYEMQETALKWKNKLILKAEKENNTDLTFDFLFVHMLDEWSGFEKYQEKLKDARCGTQMCDSSNHVVYDTSNRIYQDFINDRCKFHSHCGLYKFKEIGNFRGIRSKTFNKLSQIIESNLSSLYARDSVLSFLDEYSCYDDELCGLLPSIDFHQAFDNISDNENLVKFLELVFQQETFARIHVLECALQSGIEKELCAFDTDTFLHKCKQTDNNQNNNNNNDNNGCQIIHALMNTVLTRLLRYFDAVYLNKKKQKQTQNDVNENKENCGENKENIVNENKIFNVKNGESINIEFALWIVSIFVTILTDDTKHIDLYKMLILVFNDTLMSLLFDCIVIAPADIAIKVALMVSRIIEMYPKKNPFQDLKRQLFETAALCNDISCSKQRHVSDYDSDDRVAQEYLYITVKHVGVIANVLQNMHQNVEVATDVTIALTQLMLSITSCNYHHEYAIDLNSMSWFQSLYSTYSALKWFALNKEERATSRLQFLSPSFYSKLYDTICEWKQVECSQKRNISFINILQHNLDECCDLLRRFKRILLVPMTTLCTDSALKELKSNLISFCDISVDLGVDKLTEIEQVINISRSLSISRYASADWLILQQIKQICSKLCSAFNLLYCKIFADSSNVVDAAIQSLSPSFDSVITSLLEKSMSDESESQVKMQLASADFADYVMSRHDRILNVELKSVSDLYISVRMQSVYHLNELIIQNLNYFDLSTNNSVLCFSKHLILSRVSSSILKHSLEQSQDGQANEPSFQVDRFRCKSLDEPDYLMFTECMKQLHSFKPDTFRLEAHAKAWKCQFANEHATDAGGPYRDSIEWMMNEVQCNQHLGLFMLCPNGESNSGLNRDKYVPSPNKCSYIDEKMYIFLGKLMGLAMRTRELLPLNIAPLIWKRILGNAITVNDILSCDIAAFSIFKHLDPFINILDVYSHEIENHFNTNTNTTKNTTKNTKEIEEMIAQIEIFNSLMVRTRSKFQGKSSDGNTYPLIPNGELIPITHKNVGHYKTAFINFRMKEYDFVCNAIRRGLSTVIPINILNILSWNKVEELICGKSTIDVELFKQMTTYSNCSVNDRTIQLFWDVVKHKMNNEQRSKLLQFVWGRSRLPANKTDFDKKMSILLVDHAQNDANQYLPVSHTCFFQLDLPKYTNINVMYEKLVYAITHCGSIDTDE